MCLAISNNFHLLYLQSTRIHAFVSSKISKLFENELKEGDVYKISNFIVKDYVGDEMNRCVRNEKHIYFADFTTVTKDSNESLPIPDLSFDIKNLVDNEKMDSDKRFLCGNFWFFVFILYIGHVPFSEDLNFTLQMLLVLWLVNMLSMTT